MSALAGVKVLDLTSMVSGPVAAMMLADQGADVIKVEPTSGEQMRHIGPTVNKVTAAFFSCNRGKRSIGVDLKSEDGKKILFDLVTDADVLIQNFRPGAMERMGFGEPVLREINPRLIYVSISGFGEEGPYAHKRVYDPVIQALSCATDIQGDRATGRPQMFRIIIADKVTAITAAQAISTALYAREKSGEGQHVRLSMLDAMLSLFWPEAMAGLTYADQEFDVRKYQGAMDLIYETQDRFITAGAISNNEWEGMCRALNREDLIDHPNFKTAQGRFTHNSERKDITAEEIKKWSSEEILARFDQEGVPCAPIIDRSELLDHEQVLANGSIDRLYFEEFGEVRQARHPARFDKTPASVSRPAPRLGEHGREVLAALGYDTAAIDALVQAGTVLD
ncbi:CoA transferase [Luminiphilus sp.]|jgi:crotonobetainyl-CoA:carnitine CoA-transferase CaiB-like acyl-CoA transferase|nr:CoA transferase [Luminiphilus sp.]MDA8555318.1 CoA transferase [Luminiphilus sp.]MDA8619501.1 CoA transferase [Luminiphilus sp.]MDB2364547.1 CoA transferase [Luminiphilus sp.]MDC0572878.1 CoA transferase [Luminiphilus sp.]